MEGSEQLKTERRGGCCRACGRATRSRATDRRADPHGQGLQRQGGPQGDRAAYRFAAEHHEGQRLSGEDFIEHPLAVAQILADLGLDTTTLEAALLHDTVEDTDVSVADLERSSA